MPIVKILKSSQTFAAIKYNEERCSKGEAKLIAERNFESFLSLFSHQDYLKIWSDKNKRITLFFLSLLISFKPIFSNRSFASLLLKPFIDDFKSLHISLISKL